MAAATMTMMSVLRLGQRGDGLSAGALMDRFGPLIRHSHTLSAAAVVVRRKEKRAYK
jgi:hypothetical protein